MMIIKVTYHDHSDLYSHDEHKIKVTIITIVSVTYHDDDHKSDYIMIMSVTYNDDDDHKSDHYSYHISNL